MSSTPLRSLTTFFAIACESSAPAPASTPAPTPTSAPAAEAAPTPPVPPTQLAAKAPAPAALDGVPVEEDFEQEAETKVNAANLVATLDDLEKEIGAK